jgi:hypothetical protein
MNDEKTWNVRSYFAGDLFHFLWSIGEGQYCSRAYPQIKNHWRSFLGDDIARDIDQLVDWKTSWLSQSVLGTLFHYSNAASVKDVIVCLENPESIKQSIQKAKMPEGDRSTLIGWLSHNLEKNKERLQTVLSALDYSGYDSYWNREIRPVVEERCQEMQNQLSQYSPKEIVQNVQNILGPAYNITGEPKPIYLTYFSYALAYHLPDDSSVHSFKCDKPNDIQLFVSTLTHELLHNFIPGEELRAYYDELSDNPLFLKTRKILLEYWGEGDTEDLISAAEKYLVVKMGIVSAEQAFYHLYTNYGGAEILAAIIYDYMDSEKLEGKNYGEFLINLFQSGKIQTRTIDQQYRAVLEKRAGIEAANSTVEKIERNLQLRE